MYSILFNRLNNKLYKNKINKNRNRINKIISEKEFYFDKLEKESLVPMTYRNLYALDRFITYFKNGRADSLKEAINLFEQEVRHEEQINELRIMQQLQEATYQKANEATTLGWINLFVRR
ncbi:hypothetical protein CGZ90_13245 [Fictibacillus aquaticus]|uniref:Uncharacterized protein n=1 Tax=Fictibacillus aquaticus TaxID=2021314 RepID=A0A235F8J8_9BACL|nr:hypothetical protein CGZ90_13245 [Fictibacillus aquaticus]